MKLEVQEPYSQEIHCHILASVPEEHKIEVNN